MLLFIENMDFADIMTGFSIVKGMVELHGGRVEAFSEGIKKGSKFTNKAAAPKEKTMCKRKIVGDRYYVK